jgi:uncharacterized protein YjiK
MAGLLLAFGGSLAVAVRPGRAKGRRSASLREVLSRPTLIPSAQLDVVGLSGVAFHEALGRLFVVGDRGDLAELDLSGRRLRAALLGGDLEDVAVHAPSGLLVLVSERKGRLIAFDPRAFAEVRRWQLDRRELVGRRPAKKNAGFEGLAFRPDPRERGGGHFLLAQQRLPAMAISLAFDPSSSTGEALTRDAVLSRWTFGEQREISGLTYAAALQKYLLVDGHGGVLIVLDEEGLVVGELPLPGRQPEGLCFDSQGTLWVADDQLGLFRFKGALAALADELTHLRRPGR